MNEKELTALANHLGNLNAAIRYLLMLSPGENAYRHLGAMRDSLDQLQALIATRECQESLDKLEG